MPKTEAKTHSVSRKRKHKRRRMEKDIKISEYSSQKSLLQPSKLRLLFSHFAYFSLGSLFSLLFLFIPLQIYVWFVQLPSPDLLALKTNHKNTVILDRYGRVLYEFNGENDYDFVKLSQIPDSVLHSTLAVEDSSFYQHLGFRPLSILRAAHATVIHEHLQGGSTITQQLVKNVLLSSERTFERKIKELVLSVLVEIRYSKNEILEMYLNNISYGGNAIGVQAASKKIFGKDVWDLDLAEASMLAGLPSSPSIYSPVSGDFEKAKERQKYVLDRMFELNYISREESDTAYAEELDIKNDPGYIRAPHFVAYIKDLISDIYGFNYLENGGLTIKTSIDLDLQEKIQKIVKDGVDASKSLNISNGSALVIDPKTREILAYVGSVDYFYDSWGKFDVIRALRQPGSSIKPVTYTLALSNGMRPDTKIKDEELIIKTKWETYKPVNYDGQYHGEVTLKDALANSYNIPAVKLSYKFGPDKIVDLASRMGLRSWSSTDIDYGYSVTLGGKEVQLMELTNVYATLAQKGFYQDTAPILSVIDDRGYEIFSNMPRDLGEQVVDIKVAEDITKILSDNSARAPAFGFNSSLKVGNYKVAVKTGTTDNKRDNWTLGYTDDYVVGVWVGNNDNTPMNPRLSSGLSGAAPIWHDIMVSLLSMEVKPE